MAKARDWENRIGRRVRLRDLHVLFAVVQHGSMAKAAGPLGLTQSAVSQSVAALEDALGVRLLERARRGVAPTIYGSALLRRGRAAFDELREGVKEIEFLADPTVGEIRIGCLESIAAGILPSVIHRFSQKHPRVVLRVQLLAGMPALMALRERSLDLAVLRWAKPLADAHVMDDFDLENLFNDQLVVAAGRQTKWAHRRKLELSELSGESWILMPPETWNYMQLSEAFSSRGLPMPRIVLETQSTLLRVNLLATGPYIATFPRSVLNLYADRFELKALPIDRLVRPWPVMMVTLKNRILNPVVERFIEHLRTFQGTRGGQPAPQIEVRSPTILSG
jgi:DNA-binding transcriptional LysR family regulator